MKTRNVLYIHPPRNGGKSIEQSIYNVTPKKSSSCHKDMQGHLDIYKGNAIGDCYTFTFCRNPWDRVVSLYHASKQIYKNFYVNEFPEYLEHHTSTHSDVPSFDDYIKYKLFTCHAQQLDYIEIKNSYNINNYFLETFNDKTIFKLNFIGRFENYNEDYKKLAKNIKKFNDWDINPLVHVNKTYHEPYWSYYTEETRDIVAKEWKDDIEYFKYQFKE